MQTKTKHRSTTLKNKMSHFTYKRKEAKENIKHFKEIQMKVTFQTKSKTQNTVTPPSTNRHVKESYMYNMKCMDCPLKYMGQTGQTLYTKHKQHLQANGNNNGNPEYSNRMLNSRYTHGNITDTTKVIKTEEKGKHLNTRETYKYINEQKHITYK
jgi:hypothetical protein